MGTNKIILKGKIRKIEKSEETYAHVRGVKVRLPDNTLAKRGDFIQVRKVPGEVDMRVFIIPSSENPKLH